MKTKTFIETVSSAPLLPYIRSAGYAVREPWFFPERRLLDYLLIYVQEGVLQVVQEGVAHRFSAGDYCLLQPGDLSSLEGTTKTITPYAHMDMFYNKDREESFPTRPGQVEIRAFTHLLQPRLNDMQGIHLPLQLQPAHPAAFKETMLRMIGLWLEGDLLSQMEAHHLANELILSILKQLPLFSHTSYQKPQSLNWITSYFSFHLSEPLSLETMAKRAQLSPSRFAVVFREQFGMPPHQYLLHLRIQHAQELLRNTAYSLQEIAGYCGFSDIHHFAKTFKRMTKETPGQYRGNSR